MKPAHCNKVRFYLAAMFAITLASAEVAAAFELQYPVLKLRGGYLSSADVDEPGDDGAAELFFTQVTVSWPVEFSGSSKINFNLTGGIDHFEWKNPHRLNFSDGREPWHTLYSADFSLTYVQVWNQHWYSFLGGGFGSGWEKEIDDSFSYRGFLGTTYSWSQHWQATLGIGLGRGPEKSATGPIRGPEGTSLGPFAGIFWNKNRRELFQPGWCASLEFPPKGDVCYVINHSWAVSWNFGSFGRIYRLADNNDLSPSGLLAVSFIKSGFALDFRPSASLSVSLGVFGALDNTWEIQDDDGNALQTVYLDNPLGVEFTVSWKF